MTSQPLYTHIQSHRRVTGKLPRLRELVEHFDGKLLNVLLCLSEFPADVKAELRRAGREERDTQRRAGA